MNIIIISIVYFIYNSKTYIFSVNCDVIEAAIAATRQRYAISRCERGLIDSIMKRAAKCFALFCIRNELRSVGFRSMESSWKCSLDQLLWPALNCQTERGTRRGEQANGRANEPANERTTRRMRNNS